jgi:hypothetical protein
VSNENPQKLQDIVDVIPLDGSPKSYKPFYINKFMQKCDKYEDEIMMAETTEYARRRLLLLISYLPDKFDKVELIEDHKAKVAELTEEYKKDNKIAIAGANKELAIYLDACAYTIGRIREKFDEAFGWYEKRMMMVIGPFGGGHQLKTRGVRRSFIADDEIPPDGEYVNTKTGQKVTIRLRSMIKRHVNKIASEDPVATAKEEENGINPISEPGI